MSTEIETREDRGRAFLAGELIGWIVHGLRAVVAGLVAALTE